MTKAISTEVNQETLAILGDSYPVEATAQRISLPRLGMISQDKTEGKGKAMKVVQEAGTFYIEKQTDEQDENGKNIWEKDELGDSIEGVILYQRKQLKMYDEATEEYTSSPIYDTDDEVVPLWCNKNEVARGTSAELKAKYQYVAEGGKTKSKLEENRILYVQYKGEVYQMNLRGSSMYSFLTYARKTLPPSVITILSSESKEKGSIAWNQMMFTPKRKLTQEEAESIVEIVQQIKTTIHLEKMQYAKADDRVEIVNKEGSEAYRNF